MRGKGTNRSIIRANARFRTILIVVESTNFKCSTTVLRRKRKYSFLILVSFWTHRIIMLAQIVHIFVGNSISYYFISSLKSICSFLVEKVVWSEYSEARRRRFLQTAKVSHIMIIFCHRKTRGGKARRRVKRPQSHLSKSTLSSTKNEMFFLTFFFSFTVR